MTTGTWGWFWQDNLSQHCAFFWAALALLIPELLQYAWLIWRYVTGTPAEQADITWTPFILRLVNGVDGKWSTSRTSAFLWTYGIGFAFLAWIVWKHSADIANGGQIGDQYLVLLGFPAATAVISQAVTQAKVDSNQVTKSAGPDTVNPLAGLNQLVTDDDGNADLLDFQYFFFNTILLLYFLQQFLSHPEHGLPSLPDSLLALSGVAAAAYVAKKAVTKDAAPIIRSIVPSAGAAGTVVTIAGTGFDPDGSGPVTATFDGLLGLDSQLDSDASTGLDRLRVTVPPNQTIDSLDVVVTSSRGVNSAAAKFNKTG